MKYYLFRYSSYERNNDVSYLYILIKVKNVEKVNDFRFTQVKNGKQIEYFLGKISFDNDFIILMDDIGVKDAKMNNGELKIDIKRDENSCESYQRSEYSIVVKGAIDIIDSELNGVKIFDIEKEEDVTSLKLFFEVNE